MKNYSLRTVRRRAITIVISVLIALFVANSFAQFGGGDGTEANPWQIETAAHLNNIRNYLGEQNNNKHFVQTADIDLGVAPWNEGTGWTPIGLNAANSFRGKYDGNGHIISNLTINSPYASNRALFGYIVSAKITDLGLKDVYVRGEVRVAGLASFQDMGTIVERCYVSGDVYGFNETGGLVARIQDANSVIRNCYSAANVTRTEEGEEEIATPIAGGLIGTMFNGLCSHCYVFGKVTTHNSTLINAVIGSKIAGEIEYIYWDRESCNQETGVGRVEGFPGNTTAEMLNQETYTGFDFDDTWGIIDNFCYPYLRWQEGPSQHNIIGPTNLTGVAGDRRMDLSWQRPIMEVEPLGYNLYIDNVLHNEELIQDTEYRVSNIANWSYRNYQVTAVYEGGESSCSNTFRATAINFAGGEGTEDSPYLVETAEQLNGVRYALESHFTQIADIDLDVAPFNTGEGWLPIGAFVKGERFVGSYNGGDYAIDNLYINRNANYQGLFSFIEEGILKNIDLVNVNVTGATNVGGLVSYQENSMIADCSVSGSVTSIATAASRLGGLIGQKSGGTTGTLETNVVIRCSSTATVTGASYTGGLIGESNNVIATDGLVIDCWANGNIEGRDYVGGLIGFNRDMIKHSFATGNITTDGRNYLGGLAGATNKNIDCCYARGAVSGGRYVGGLVGMNTAANISASYSTGRVNGDANTGGLVGSHTGQVDDNCYWDTESSNMATSAGGSGRRSRQMCYPYDEMTYVGWNFNEVWTHDIGNINDGYPILYYQYVRIDVPDVEIRIVQREETDYVQITWEPVEMANSYKVYSSSNLDDEDWGEPTVVFQARFEEPVETRNKFYRVVASIIGE